MSDLTKLIAPSFYGVHHDIKAGRHTHYWLKGGRGSTKSSFISVEIILGMMQDAAANALVLRKVAVNLKDSVYEQLLWAIEASGDAGNPHHQPIPDAWRQQLFCILQLQPTEKPEQLGKSGVPTAEGKPLGAYI